MRCARHWRAHHCNYPPRTDVRGEPGNPTALNSNGISPIRTIGRQDVLDSEKRADEFRGEFGNTYLSLGENESPQNVLGLARNDSVVIFAPIAYSF